MAKVNLTEFQSMVIKCEENVSALNLTLTDLSDTLAKLKQGLTGSEASALYTQCAAQADAIQSLITSIGKVVNQIQEKENYYSAGLNA